MSRAGGRGLSDGVEAEGLEQERMTRQNWLGRLCGNPAAATEELKPLERIGPAQMERSANGAIPLCESVADGVQSSGTAGCHSLASPLAPGGCVSSVAD